MRTISEFMIDDHERCDAHLELAERAAERGDLVELAAASEAFFQRIEAHIEMEDRVLFPAFDRLTGMGAGGPTATMVEEHRQMEALFEEMRQAIAAQDTAAYLRASARMLEILVPHNEKEEQMMYPMLDQAMGAEAGALLEEAKAQRSPDAAAAT